MNWEKAVSGANARAIGSGYQNTVDINAQAGNVAASSAAVYAFGYSNNGKSDWHLPSKDELNELCKYAKQQTTGDPLVFCTSSSLLRTDFSAVDYWSSSEWGYSELVDRFAWFQDFNAFGSYGGQGGYVKSRTFRVRPVRAF
jgi:hypothetical protein